MELSTSRRTLIFITVMCTSFMTSALGTALSTAIAPISSDMGISVATGQWLTSGYTLIMAIIMPLTAFLIRRFPTKRLFLIGIGIGLFGLVVATLAPVFPILLLGRIIQACGNGILFAMSQVVIISIYPIEKRGSALGIFGMAGTASPVIAPTLGGIVIDLVGWRGIFAIVFCVMACLFVLAFFVFKNVLETERKHFDILSFVLSMFTFGGIILGIGNLGTYGITSFFVWPLLVIGVVAAVIFARRQLHLDEPFIDVRMYMQKEYTIATISTVIVYFVLYGSLLIMPLYVESALGLSATIAGLVTMPGSLALVILSPIAGRIYDKYGMKLLFFIGSILLIASNIAMLPVTIETPIAVAIVLKLLRCLGAGCFMMPLIAWGTSNVRQEIVADATAMLSSMGQIGGSLGSAVLVAVMATVSAGSMAEGSAANIANMDGTVAAFALMTIVSVVLFIFAFLVNRKDKGKDHVIAQKEVGLD